MIASWRGLAVTAALAVVLAVIAIADLVRAPGAPGPGDRALVPGFDPARATELIWERAGQPAIRALRVGERWELRVPAALPADPDAIGDALAALRGARWHRRGESPAPHATLTAVVGGERHVLGIAAPIAGTEQVWIAVDGRGAVVDGWVARALDRDRLALHIRRPLADAAAARSIAVTGAVPGGAPIDLQLEANPRRLVRPAALLVASELAGELERVLREVTIVRLPDGPLAAGGLAIRIATAGPAAAEVAVAIGGGCPGAPALVALSSSAGDGCIEPGGLTAIAAAVTRLQQPPAAVVERRPVPFEPRRIALADGVELETSPPRVGGAEADPARVIELLAALAAPAEVVAVPAGPPTGHLIATDRGGAAIALDLFAAGVVARRGEPVALRPAPGAARLLVRPSRELRDLTLWVEEPTSIAAIAVDGARFERGAVIGSWQQRLPGPGRAPAAALDELATRLAAPRALGFGDDRLAVVHRIAIEMAPPVGPPIHHSLEIGAPRAAGCPARAGRDIVILPAALCAGVAAVAR